MPSADPRRVAIWAAVSSKAQLDGDSLPGQIRAGQEWSASIDAQVVATFQVPGHSRDYIFFQNAAADMPAYRELQQACESRAFDVLWCRARDRLGRTDALIAQVEALVAGAGAQIYSALMPQPLETSDVAQIYMSAMERASSQAENVIRVKRSISGQRARARQGLSPGRSPYGYRPIHGDPGGAATGYRLEDLEAETIRIITDLFLEGHGYEVIAKELDRIGRPPMPRSNAWHDNQVHRIMHNDWYAGTVEWGGEILCTRSDKFPHLWDPATHRAVIRERERRSKKKVGRPPGSHYTGLVFCNRCEYQMGYDSVGADYRYFRCVRHKRRGDCHNNATRLAKVRDAVEGIIRSLRTGDLDPLIDQARPDAQRLERQRALARETVASVKQKRRRLGRLVVDGRMAADVYTELDQELQAELEAAARRRADAERQLAALPQPDEIREQFREILAWATDEPGWIERQDLDVARTALLNTGLRIWCEDNEVTRVTIG